MVQEEQQQQQHTSLCSSSSLLLLPRSLLIFKDDAFDSYLHGIDQVAEEGLDNSVCNLHLCPTEIQALAGGTLPRGTERVSLTVRRVPRVIKGFMQLAGQRGDG